MDGEEEGNQDCTHWKLGRPTPTVMHIFYSWLGSEGLMIRLAAGIVMHIFYSWLGSTLMIRLAAGLSCPYFSHGGLDTSDPALLPDCHAHIYLMVGLGTFIIRLVT